MANEKFLQRLRSKDKPHGNRVTKEMEAITPHVTVEPIGRHVLMDRMKEEEKEAVTRQFMNTPVYPSSATARARSLHLGRSRGGKALRHPLAG